MDPITLAVGGGLLLAGYLAGSRSRRRRKKETAPVEAVCGCAHSLALHDPDTGKCHSEIARKHYDENGDHTGKEYVACPCRRYIGPKPAEEILHQRFLPPAE